MQLLFDTKLMMNDEFIYKLKNKAQFRKESSRVNLTIYNFTTTDTETKQHFDLFKFQHSKFN